MRLTNFNENDRVLLLGEGNFSFAVDFYKHNLDIKITATCYEPTPINEFAVKNISFLKNHGIPVVFGIDATKIANHVDFKHQSFDKIIFNFPHVNRKMRLDLNRELLQKFFQSAQELLDSCGKLLVSLRNGQGGTKFDSPQRKWDDSWKIKEMAAHGNFVLTAVEPFIPSNFVNYTNTGFRGQDKEFFSEKSLLHIFEKSETPSVFYLKPAKTIDLSTLKLSINPLNFREVANIKRHNEIFGPPIFVFDVTFTVNDNFNENIFYATMYNNIGRVVKDIEFLRLYEYPGLSKIARTYRICYHAEDVPLFRARVLEIHHKLIPNILEDL